MIRKMDTCLADWKVGDTGTYLEDYYCLKDRTSIEIPKAMLMVPNVENKQFICIAKPDGDYTYYLFLYKETDSYYLVEVD